MAKKDKAARPRVDSLDGAKAALRDAEAALERVLKERQGAEVAAAQRLAELAHEIKTPLTAMLGFTQVMSEEILGPMGKPEYKSYAGILNSSALHLLGICDRLLEPEENGAENAKVALQPVDVGPLINGVVDLFSQMAKDRGIALDAEIADGFPVIQSDPVRLNQALINLVSNAIKFTPKGGHVGVEARVDETAGAVILVIRDSGQGMSPETLARVLTGESQNGETSPHGDEGAGLGLTIVKRLMAELKGAVEVQSEPDVGTVVALILHPSGSGDATTIPTSEYMSDLGLKRRVS